MNYANLIQNITENIKTNGSQAITAQVLQDVLVDMVGELGQSGALLGGVIDTSFVPDSTNDAQVVYIAESPGTYTNFNGLVVGAGEVAFFYFDGNAWAKSSVDVLEVVNSLNSTATDKALSAAMGKQLQDSLTQAVNDLTTAIGNKADRQTTEQALNTLQNQINDKADTTYVNSQLATKADTASVNAALALKADTSAVNAALATKADTSALATKADKVVGAVAGNMAGLDADGNLVDSGINSSAVGDVANKIDRVVGAEVGNVAAFDAIGGVEDSGVAADNIAEQDGYYETMVVGGAENLIGSDIVSSQFTRRKTGGSTDVGTGVAILKTIKGNTLVWNQLVDTGTTSVTIPSGHKYYSIINGVRSLGTSTGAAIAVTGGTDSVFDLTQMFGAGNEPATAAEFEALFPLNYYAYDSGSLLNLTATGLQTNGFNRLNLNRTAISQYWAHGAAHPFSEDKYIVGFAASDYFNPGAITNYSVNNNTIEVQTSTAGYGLGFPIKCFPSTSYYFGMDVWSGTNHMVAFYDSDGIFISYATANSSTHIFTTPANAYWMVVCYVPTSVNTLVTRTQNIINISDTDKNGTYEPYWTETKVLPITTATSGGVAIFSDGMKSAGTAYDEMTATKATKRIGVVDLGGYSWGYTAPSGTYPYGFFSAAITDKKDGILNILCAKYEAKVSWSIDKIIRGGGSNIVYVIDSSYTDAATFKAAMSGVYLYYELATPTEYTLDTPFNTQYRVDNDGTETVLPENTSTPTTSPIVADINYALNAIDTIRNLPQNYISKASMDAILTAFKTAGVITNYTLTWDATNQKYNCTITA